MSSEEDVTYHIELGTLSASLDNSIEEWDGDEDTPLLGKRRPGSACLARERVPVSLHLMECRVRKAVKSLHP